MFSDKRFGLSSSLIAATRGVLAEAEDKEDKDKSDPKMMKGGKTKVDLEPKTDDDVREADVDKKKSVKEGKEHTVPKTDKEKKLASLAHPKDKITHKDVLVGRGVIAKEEVELDEAHGVIVKASGNKHIARVIGRLKSYGSVEDKVFHDKKEAINHLRKFGIDNISHKGYEKIDEEVELSAEELERIEAIAQSLDENWSKGASRSYLTDRIDAGKSLNNADHYLKRSKGAEKLNPSMSKELKIKYHKEMAKFHKSGYHGEHQMAASTMAQAKKEVKKHKDAAAAIKSSMNEEVELDEAKPTIVSAPIRGANQDQSGENTKSVSGDYTISDSKKMKKEEVELDEAKRGRPKKNPTPDDEQDEHEHVIMQLRKVVSTHGALPVKHLDGKSTKITPQLAQHALNKHSAMKTAAEKQDFETKMHKSHDSMKSALGQ